MAGAHEGPFSILLPWYATLFRYKRFAEALDEIAPIALRYGATGYRVYQSQEDLYKFWHFTTVPTKLAWERYWYGEEFSRWRAEHSAWYQVPIVYTVAQEIAAGAIETEPAQLDA
ncbi:MAG TPA: hypothetical protein VHR88_02930 [Solirubrobacteraceae bacterium]|jgi:hypothetical protein|nr:hypothetical protein [Solirubrobacteraceae bacterium]